MKQPLTDYLKNKQKQEQTRFVIKNGEGNYYPRQTPIPKKEFENWYPLGKEITLFNHVEKGINPNGRLSENW
ncbi:MAG TPA: hypothetical protein PKV73_00965 [Agriterribacter sp.]|nr:hypothetical protein [Agriterribacter sp.]